MGTDLSHYLPHSPAPFKNSVHLSRSENLFLLKRKVSEAGAGGLISSLCVNSVDAKVLHSIHTDNGLLSSDPDSPLPMDESAGVRGCVCRWGYWWGVGMGWDR